MIRATLEAEETTAEDTADEATTLPASQEGAGATDGLTSGHGEEVYQRLVLIPADSEAAAPAFISLRGISDLDSNAYLWEAIGFYAGENSFDCPPITSRRTVIEDAIKALFAKASKSRKKVDKNAAKKLAEYLGALNALPADDTYGPEGEDDPGRSWGGGLEATEEAADVEQPADQPANTDAPAPPSQLAGSGEGVAPTPSANNYGDFTPAEEAAFREQLDKAKDELADAAVENAHAEAIAKSAKTRFKDALSAFTRIADRGPKAMPLLDGVEATFTTATLPASLASETSGQVSQVITSVEPWRLVPISALGLPPKLAEKLEEAAGITTIGKLEDVRGSFDGLKGIKGIGPAKITLIEDAVIKWLSVNRDAAVFAEAASAGK